MSLEIVPYKAEHALLILEEGGQQPNIGTEQETLKWAKNGEILGPAKTGFWHGKIIGCGGLLILWPGVGEAWCLFSKDIPNNVLQIRMLFAETIKTTLDSWIDEYHLWRVQTPLRADYPLGIKFSDFLGLHFEAKLEKYHWDKCDALMYAIVR